MGNKWYNNKRVKLSKGHYKTKTLTEKRLGRPIPDDVLTPFFNYTDKGIEPDRILASSKEWKFIMQAFALIAYDYNCYVEDFKKGLLFLSDFNGEDLPTKELALQAYKSSMGEIIKQ